MKQDRRGNRTGISKSSFPPEELKSKILRGYCGDQLSLEYCLGWMDWACGLMTQSEDADISEDGQLRQKLKLHCRKSWKLCIIDLNLSEVKSHFEKGLRGGLKRSYPLGYYCKGTLWQGDRILDKGWGRRITNIYKSCYLHIKCFPANSLAALMWRWYLNSERAAL